MSKGQDFQDFLTTIDDGRLHEQLTATLPRLVKQVRETNKVGELTIKLKFKPEGGGTMLVTPSVSVKVPAPAVNGSVLWTDEDGNTFDRDPKQLPLRAIDPTPIRNGK